jgi:hypothetical protein
MRDMGKDSGLTPKATTLALSAMAKRDPELLPNWTEQREQRSRLQKSFDPVLLKETFELLLGETADLAGECNAHNIALTMYAMAKTGHYNRHAAESVLGEVKRNITIDDFTTQNSMLVLHGMAKFGHYDKEVVDLLLGRVLENHKKESWGMISSTFASVLLSLANLGHYDKEVGKRHKLT